MFKNAACASLNSARALASSLKRFNNCLPSAVKPSEDDPIQAVVLMGDDLKILGSEDWNTIVENYIEIVFARTTPLT